MMFRIIKVFIILITIYSVRAQTYTAGVVVFKGVVSQLLTPDAFFANNTATYMDLIRQNKDKVDILVFPEYGLTNIKAKDSLKPHLRYVSSVIGNVSDKVCVESDINVTEKGHLANISCLAKESDIYVIANLFEKADENYYITTVGLDPAGNLCLKCRKSHLVNGSNFERSTDEKSCKFTAKFKKNGDVSFSVLFGDDVVYPIPAAIKTENVIMTSAIKNTLPLNVGFSLYQGFAVSNGVNLLVSGYYEKNTKREYDNYGGSGIYYANGSSIVAYKPDASESDAGQGMVLRADMPIKTSLVSTVQVKSQLIGNIPTMDLQNMYIPGLNDTSKTVQNCSDPKKCCHFKAELTDDTIQPYKWIVLANKTTIVNQEVDIFLCAIIAPPSANPQKTFKNITISSTIDKSKISQSLPLSLGTNLLPIDFIYNNDINQLILSKEGNVAVFGILHVLNSSGNEPGTNVALIVIITLLCIALVVLLVGYLIWRKRQRKNRRSL